MGDDNIDGTLPVNGIQPCFVIYRCFVRPIDIGRELTVTGLHAVLVHPPSPVDGDGTAHTEDGMPAGFDDGIVRQGLPTLVSHLLTVEIGRVVVVPAYEHYPVVGLGQTVAEPHIDTLIVAWLMEAKAAVTGDYYQGVSHAILDAAFIHKFFIVTVYVTADYNPFGIGKLIYVDTVTHFLFQSFCQELPQMEVRDTFRILLADQWGHGNDILRIVVLDSTEIAELTLSRFFVGNNI